MPGIPYRIMNYNIPTFWTAAVYEKLQIDINSLNNNSTNMPGGVEKVGRDYILQ